MGTRTRIGHSTMPELQALKGKRVRFFETNHSVIPDWEGDIRYISDVVGGVVKFTADNCITYNRDGSVRANARKTRKSTPLIIINEWEEMGGTPRDRTGKTTMGHVKVGDKIRVTAGPTVEGTVAELQLDRGWISFEDDVFHTDDPGMRVDTFKMSKGGSFHVSSWREVDILVPVEEAKPRGDRKGFARDVKVGDRITIEYGPKITGTVARVSTDGRYALRFEPGYTITPPNSTKDWFAKNNYQTSKGAVEVIFHDTGEKPDTGVDTDAMLRQYVTDRIKEQTGWSSIGTIAKSTDAFLTIFKELTE